MRANEVSQKAQKAVIECEREVDIRLAIAPDARVELSFELHKDKANGASNLTCRGASHEI